MSQSNFSNRTISDIINNSRLNNPDNFINNEISYDKYNMNQITSTELANYIMSANKEFRMSSIYWGGDDTGEINTFSLLNDSQLELILNIKWDISNDILSIFQRYSIELPNYTVNNGVDILLKEGSDLDLYTLGNILKLRGVDINNIRKILYEKIADVMKDDDLDHIERFMWVVNAIVGFPEINLVELFNGIDDIAMSFVDDDYQIPQDKVYEQSETLEQDLKKQINKTFKQ